MRRCFMLLLLIAIHKVNLAQDAEAAYYKREAEIQKEIWRTAPEPFQVKKIPVEMNNEGAVIIARSFVVTSNVTTDIKFNLGKFYTFNYQTIFHERVKLNDKNSLDAYSSIEYLKKLDLDYSFGFSQFSNNLNTFVGAKIIKPDDKEIIVNTGEEVLTTDEKNTKIGKLAIPGLEKGDILDYYVLIERMIEGPNYRQRPYTFHLGGAYPILYYYVKFYLDKNFGVSYVNANGAPAFKTSKDGSGNIILGLALKNIPKIQNAMWTSPYRQYPYISIQYRYVGREDVIMHNSLSTTLIEQYKQLLASPVKLSRFPAYTLVKSYTQNVGNITKKSTAALLYNAWRYYEFCASIPDDVTRLNENKFSHGYSLDNVVYMSQALKALNIDHTVYLARSRYGTAPAHELNLYDFNALIKINAEGEHWIAFNDIVTVFDEIPDFLQGEDAVIIQPKTKYHKETDQLVHETIPVVSADKNSISEALVINFDSSNMQSLHIERTCSQAGALRHNNQKELLLMEDIDSDLSEAVAKKKLSERSSDKVANDLLTAFAKEREEQKEAFTDEINRHFDAEPKDLLHYSITKSSLLNSGAPFEYKEIFTVEDFVKKGGNNYIVEAGKLIGVYPEIGAKERDRAIDVYMPCARTFKWNIIINIPKGYTIKEMESLNKASQNETGSFNCTATVDGTTANITVALVYNNNFEKAANWPQLLQLLDALYHFNNQKILLEKIN